MQEQIGALKEGLAVERKKRYHKEIYEEACKDINKYPPHKATKVRKTRGKISNRSCTAGLFICALLFSRVHKIDRYPTSIAEA